MLSAGRRDGLFAATVVAAALLLAEETSALRCKSCRTGVEPECDADCSGDLCAVWMDSRLQRIHGCLSGLATRLPTGCRRNDAGATLCLCDDADGCNTERLLSATARSLPSVQCSDFVQAPYIEQSDDALDRSCTSNYCFFHNSTVTNIVGQVETQVTADCSQLPAFSFDVQVATLWPGPGATAGACYLLQAHGTDTTLGCMCAAERCNRRQPYAVVPGRVRCHLAYNTVTPAEHEQDTCLGHYCLIQRTTDLLSKQARFMKGCLSLSDPALVRPGRRDILGVQQWFCDTPLCNARLPPGALPSPAPDATPTNDGASPPTTTDQSATKTAFRVTASLVPLLLAVVLLR